MLRCPGLNELFGVASAGTWFEVMVAVQRKEGKKREKRERRKKEEEERKKRKKIKRLGRRS